MNALSPRPMRLFLVEFDELFARHLCRHSQTGINVVHLIAPATIWYAIYGLLYWLADQLELVWVRGNHDYDAESVAHLIGATFVPEYTFQSGNRDVLCVHGDAWDRFLTDHPIITCVADWFYLRIQRWSRRLANRAKRSSKTFLRCVDRVRTEAIEYGKAKRADVVVCGHTHFAESADAWNPSACAYYNTGAWTDHHCHHLTIKDGNIQLLEATMEAPATLEPVAV